MPDDSILEEAPTSPSAATAPPAAINPYVASEPLIASFTSNPVWIGSMCHNPPSDQIDTAYVQAHFPAPFGSTTAPDPLFVHILASDPNFPALPLRGKYSGSVGWAEEAYYFANSVQMAFNIFKAPDQSWPQPMLITIRIDNQAYFPVED